MGKDIEYEAKTVNAEEEEVEERAKYEVSSECEGRESANQIKWSAKVSTKFFEMPRYTARAFTVRIRFDSIRFTNR